MVQKRLTSGVSSSLPEALSGWWKYASVHLDRCLARSLLSQRAWRERAPQPTSSQLLLRTTMCQRRGRRSSSLCRASPPAPRSSRNRACAPRMWYSWLPTAGLRALLVLAPRGAVAVAELRACAVGVGVVAEGEDGSPIFCARASPWRGRPWSRSGRCLPRRPASPSASLPDARLCRQQNRHARQQHRRGHRTDDENGLLHPLRLSSRGVEAKSENAPPVTQPGLLCLHARLEQLPRTPPRALHSASERAVSMLLSCLVG